MDQNYLIRLFTVPYFSVGFLRLECFDQTAAILVCKGEGNLERVSKLLRVHWVGEEEWEKYKYFSCHLPPPTPLSN